MLDRDGTIIKNIPYLSDPDLISFLPGAIAGLNRLVQAGFGLVIISNQSGIARGLVTPDQLNAIHTRLRKLLADEGIPISGIYYCPHHPDDRCACRKPQPGLLVNAIQDNQFDPEKSFMIGDSMVDIGFGKNAGAYTILVRTGNGKETESLATIRPDCIVDTLADAAVVILRISSGVV